MLTTLFRLQLAMRIHLALLRGGRAGVDVLRMLREGAYARRVLGLCHDGDDFALCSLADDFGDTLAIDDARRELARAALRARAALTHLALGSEGAVIVRRAQPARQRVTATH